MSDEIVIEEGEAFYLHPGELALAVTFESVTLPATWSAGLTDALPWRVQLRWCTSPRTVSIRAGLAVSCWSSLTPVNCRWRFARE